MVGGAALLAAAAIGGLALVLSDDGGSDSNEGAGATERAAAPDSSLTELLRKRDAGIKVRYPQEWRKSERRGLITLQSPDRCLAITVAAPVAAGDARALRRDSISALRRSFRRVQVQPQNDREVGGLRSTSDLIGVRARGGAPVIVRQSVASGERFAYLTQVVLRDPPCAAAAPEANAIIASLEFTR